MTDERFTADDLAAGERLFARPWIFVKGVAGLDGLPDGARAEVAFAGRSNAGKSSLLNALARTKTLARTSNTPGRTQELNFFEPADASAYLVDMPGYGFARAPKDKVEAWTKLVRAYLRGRPALRRVFVLLDARHGVKPPDQEIMEMLDTAAVSYQGVLTKIDKSNDAERTAMIAATEVALARHPAAFPQVLATSAVKGDGLDELRATIAAVIRD
jgi:GTP-binding protein